MFTDFRIKFRNFIKRNKGKVVVAIVICFSIIAVNIFLSNATIRKTPITTYTPDLPIIENGNTVPDKYKEPIENLIKEYIGYCNNKEYEKAYNMITAKCKENTYPKLEDFKAYVNYVFMNKMAYSIQNYSNREDTYIYRVRIFEDVLATGMTYSDSLLYFEDKFVISQKDGKLYLNVKGYVGEEILDYMYEDQYMKINVTKKTMTYDEESYKVEIRNKTENIIVLANDVTQGDILLKTNSGNKNLIKEETWTPVVIMPGMKNSYNMKFTNFYDMNTIVNAIHFDSARILKSYSGTEETKEQEIANAVSLYSFDIPFSN